MGKKDKKAKKGKGAEKTASKTEKKLSAKQKKELAAIGEVSSTSFLNLVMDAATYVMSLILYTS